MKVFELIEKLQRLPDQHMEVVVDRHSDYGDIGNPSITNGVRQNDWIMRLSDKDVEHYRSTVQRFVYIPVG